MCVLCLDGIIRRQSFAARNSISVIARVCAAEKFTEIAISYVFSLCVVFGMVYFVPFSHVLYAWCYLLPASICFALKNEWTHCRHQPHILQQPAICAIFCFMRGCQARALLLCGEHFAADSINFSTEQKFAERYLQIARSNSASQLFVIYRERHCNKWVAYTRKCEARSWNVSANNWMNSLKIKPYF